MNVLELKDVRKTYQEHVACNNISFDIPEGKIFGLLGPNGAGKTSLIRIITTITRADSGSILFRGEPLNSTHPSQIGYMAEERGLYKKMKVAEQITYLARLKGFTKKEAKKDEPAKKTKEVKSEAKKDEPAKKKKEVKSEAKKETPPKDEPSKSDTAKKALAFAGIGTLLGLNSANA